MYRKPWASVHRLPHVAPLQQPYTTYSHKARRRTVQHCGNHTTDSHKARRRTVQHDADGLTQDLPRTKEEQLCFESSDFFEHKHAPQPRHKPGGAQQPHQPEQDTHSSQHSTRLAHACFQARRTSLWQGNTRIAKSRVANLKGR